MNWRKRFTSFFILFFLLSTFVASFHHHNGATDDHDCPICIAGNHQSTAGPSAGAFDGIPFETETAFIASTPAFADALFFFFYTTRGPPA